MNQKEKDLTRLNVPKTNSEISPQAVVGKRKILELIAAYNVDSKFSSKILGLRRCLSQFLP